MTDFTAPFYCRGISVRDGNGRDICLCEDDNVAKWLVQRLNGIAAATPLVVTRNDDPEIVLGEMGYRIWATLKEAGYQTLKEMGARVGLHQTSVQWHYMRLVALGYAKKVGRSIEAVVP